MFGQLGGAFRDHSGIILESFRGHSRVIPGSLQGHSGIIPGSFRDHSRVIQGFAVWIQRRFGAGSARRSGQPGGGRIGSDRHQAGWVKKQARGQPAGTAAMQAGFAARDKLVGRHIARHSLLPAACVVGAILAIRAGQD